MAMLEILSTYTKLSSYKFESEDDDDLVDKVFRKFSSIVMIIFSLLLGIYQLVGSPIKCWCNNELDIGGRCKYAKTYCYITATYVPVNNGTTDMPNRDDLQNHGILYYQWVPYIFILQAFIFYAPHIVWKYLSGKSGFDLRNYIKNLKSDNSDLKNSNAVKYVVSHIKSTMDFHKSYQHRGIFKMRIITQGFYLTACLIFVKCLYAAVTLFQIYLLNYWLKDSYNSGLGLFQTVFGAHNFRFNERFPRMTLCTFSVYILNDQQTHWVQCALPINIYIEKMYIILWAWLWILLALITVNIAKTVFDIFQTKRFIVNRGLDLDEEEQDNLARNLNTDGILMLRLVKSNTNDFYVNTLVSSLSDFFSKYD